ncbi:Ldh family oxidoreductase [Plasticicumulans acidivorans]|uniref:LDH2 family malate/lactate/ureidoglycolate dehydrogenase n=1 Tax=Plasticicumulans acidivorans TaxID=886464 RepID=A0A317MYK6_9GAMM|nr:Ldh family oxidoreductase [Plasticicumulans acidivorans]PWV64428.1 LDH2 family malate/lactate/ureidoglycolate dehydrogenase [Plasticicumulans acidivorans]
MIRLTLTEAGEFAESILRRHGFSEAYVRAIAATVVAGERDGCASHGLYRLLGCIATLKAGKVIADAEPELVDQAPGLVRVDAHGGFSQLAFQAGLPLLCEKARSQGIAALAINRCVHFSALWVEMEAIAEAGLAGLACNPTQAYVAPAGGSRPLFGTNPLAFGWPRSDALPFIFDFATSAVARGEIELHRRAGKAIPEGWGVDGEGRSCTDPATVLDEGAMLPFGGHKGSALSAMIELLAGVLIGDLTSAESLAFDAGSKALPYHGELIIALDPQRFLGADTERHLARAETLFSAIEAQGARLPSQRRYSARAISLAEGVQIPRALYEDLKGLLEAGRG